MKSLVNRLYLNELFYSYKMSNENVINEQFDEFNNLILDLVNIDVKIIYEYQTLLLLCSLHKMYDHFKETLLCGRKTLSLKEIQATTLSLKELNEKFEVEVFGATNGLLVRGRQSTSDNSGAKVEVKEWLKYVVYQMLPLQKK